MILDILPNQYEALGRKYMFRPWQTGLLAEMLQGRNKFLSLNMGRSAGHTYFTKVVASSGFPYQTKVYVARQENLIEFSDLLFDETKVHRPIGLLDHDNFNDFSGDYVDFVVIDMNQEHTRHFKSALNKLINSLPDPTSLIILQANFFNF